MGSLGEPAAREPEVAVAARIWRRLPVMIRAVVVGAIVSLLGQVGSAIPMAVNLKMTCGLLLAFNITFHFAYARFLPISIALPETLLALPKPTLAAVLLLISAQAGIVEEAAFRGYMFTPIERRHGPAAATVVVSVVFLLAHFNNPQNLNAFRIVSIFFAGVVYCVLVVVTGSILPGLVTHAVGDAIGLLLLWRAATHAGTPAARLGGMGEALQDPGFLGMAGAALALGLAAIRAFVRLRFVARRDPGL